MARGESRDPWPSRINCSLATEFSLVQENILLQNERITQLYVIQAEQNPFLWFGVLFVDAGPYKGSVVRFNMYIDETYPDCTCPKVVFYPIPSHPLVNPTTGELDTKNAFPDWTSNTRKLYELLFFVKRVIRQADEYIEQIRNLMFDHLKSNCRHSDERRTSEKEMTSFETISNEPTRSQGSNVRANTSQEEQVLENCDLGQAPDAFEPGFRDMFTWFHHTLDFIKIYENDRDEFQRRVEQFGQTCQEQLLDRPALCGDDGNAIVFSPWNQEIHEPMRTCVLGGRFTPSSMFASYHKETDSVSFVPGHEPGLD